jgi:hypothetical protein
MKLSDRNKINVTSLLFTRISYTKKQFKDRVIEQEVWDYCGIKKSQVYVNIINGRNEMK